jgi:hypothetical protein
VVVVQDWSPVIPIMDGIGKFSQSQFQPTCAKDWGGVAGFFVVVVAAN